MAFTRSAQLLLSVSLAGAMAAGAQAQSRSAEEVLADVTAAMGAEDLESISVSGRAWTIRNGFRQTRTASPPWMGRDEIMDYVRTIDLEAPASMASGRTYAPNMFFEPPVWGDYAQAIPADRTAWSAQHSIWLTPWGFLAGAEANGVTLSEEDGATVLSWTSPADQTAPSGEPYRVNAVIGPDNLIAMTETWVDDRFMGDMRVASHFLDYAEMDGVMVPSVTEIEQGGGAVFGLTITGADANPDNLAELMESEGGPGGFGGFGGGGGEPPDPADLAQKLAPGVWQITGGYTALVVEFEDDLVVFEAGQSEARGETVLAAIETISDKPIRGVVNSHPHSDHSGGLIPVVKAGIPLIVSENAEDFMQMALSSPRAMLGEETMEPEFITVPDGGELVFEDSMNRFELHHIPNLHTDSMLFGYLPEHGIAIQADFTLRYDDDGNLLPGDQQTILIWELAQVVRDKGMEFDTLVGVHASPRQQTSEDVLVALDR